MHVKTIKKLSILYYIVFSYKIISTKVFSKKVLVINNKKLNVTR